MTLPLITNDMRIFFVSKLTTHQFLIAQELMRKVPFPKRMTYKFSTMSNTRRGRDDTRKDQDHTRTHTHGYTRTNHVDNSITTLTRQIQMLQTQIQDMQRGTVIRYSLQEICLYPFDRNLNMIPFPIGCETPHHDKYNASTDPQIIYENFAR